MLSQLEKMLSGRKTYIVAILIAAFTIMEQQYGIVIPEYVFTLLGAAGLAAVRSGISKLKA